MDIFSLLTLLLSFAGFGMALGSSTKEEHEQRAENSGPPEPHYVEAVTVTQAKDVSGGDGDFHFERDTAILMSLDIGQGFEPDLYIGGNFAIDWDSWDNTGEPPRKKPLEWGGNFKVDELAARAGLTPLFDQSRDDNVIREDVLHGLVGQTIVYLRYVYGEKDDGSLGYSNYDRVRFPNNFVQEAQTFIENQNGGKQAGKEEVKEKALEMAKQSLEDQFLDDVAGDFVDDYKPEVIDGEEDDDFNDAAYSGDGAPSGTGWDAEQDETFEPDDEMPL